MEGSDHMANTRNLVIGSILVFSVVTNLLCMLRMMERHSLGTQYADTLEDLAQQQAMKALSAKESTITLCVVDLPVISLFVNWYRSAKTVAIHNILPVALDEVTHKALQQFKITSYLEPSVREHTSYESDFLSESFKLKGKMKFVVALRLLKLGYAVLLSDIDIYFFKNPFPYLDCFECDFEIQQDHPQNNAVSVGFVYFRPTLNTRGFLEIFISELNADPNLWDQATFRHMMNIPVENRTIPYSFKSRILSPAYFVTGGTFTDHLNEHSRMPYIKSPLGDILSLPTKTRHLAVIYHNSWVGRSPSKIYRFREMGLWTSDFPNQYYSKSNRKYISYRNPWREFSDLETDGLDTAMALAGLLNRTLIIPKFHCPGENQTYPCSLQEVASVDSFQFLHNDGWREHAFLNHPLVPEVVTKSRSPEILILSKRATNGQIEIGLKRNLTVFRPRDLEQGPTDDELLFWLEPYSDFSVLRLHSVYFPMASRQFNIFENYDDIHNDPDLLDLEEN